MSYISEFPNYDGEFHNLEGWQDNSWSNDTCPHIEKFGAKGETEISICIWQDYVDVNKREYDNTKRYLFQICINDCVIFAQESDNWKDMEKLAENVSDYEWKWEEK